VRISSKGQNGVITGHLIHHPIQCRYPEWDDNFDIDGPMAKKTRRAFCERYALGSAGIRHAFRAAVTGQNLEEGRLLPLFAG
jgi:hypothetical protein